MGSRRHARECALMVLFGMDMSAQGCDAALERFWESFGTGQPLDPPPPHAQSATASERYVDWFGVTPAPETRAYAERLVRGTWGERDAIDAMIQKISHNWRMERMACVDRNLIRLGVFELTSSNDELPRGVVINEAVELAKLFGSAESSAFVNGILDRVGRGADGHREDGA